MRRTARITALRLMLAGRCGHSVTPVSATGSGVPLCAVPCLLRRSKLRFFGVSLCETPKAAPPPLLFPKSLATFGVPFKPLGALTGYAPPYCERCAAIGRIISAPTVLRPAAEKKADPQNPVKSKKNLRKIRVKRGLRYYYTLFFVV